MRLVQGELSDLRGPYNSHEGGQAPFAALPPAQLSEPARTSPPSHVPAAHFSGKHEHGIPGILHSVDLPKTSASKGCAERAAAIASQAGEGPRRVDRKGRATDQGHPEVHGLWRKFSELRSTHKAYARDATLQKGDQPRPDILVEIS